MFMYTLQLQVMSICMQIYILNIKYFIKHMLDANTHTHTPY